MQYKQTPWKHQLTAIERAKSLPGFALFFEMGAGKTGTCINILRWKYNVSKRILRTIILCPPIVVPNWKEEWVKHSSLDPALVVPLVGSGKKRLENFRANAYGSDGQPKGAVFVTNYEALLMPELYELFEAWRPEALVFDESHKLKSHSAKRSKLAEKLANPYDKKAKVYLEKPLTYILTGTPVLNTPMDLFQQFLILDGGESFGKNFFTFRARYFYDKNIGMPAQKHFPDFRIKSGALDELNSMLFSRSMRVLKSECMDLPPLVQQTLKVGMSPEQARVYKEMKQDFIAYMGDKTCLATLAITKAQRLNQIASGFVKVVEGEEIALESTPKMEALRELLETITTSHKVLVWAVWRQNYAEIEKVCQELGLGTAHVYGGLSQSKKDENVARFKTDPDCKVFIGNPTSAGIGINLVNAPYSIFYSRTFSLDESLQAEARNHRGGSEIHEKITRIDIVCENTIEELIQKKLASKLDMSFNLLRDLSHELKNQG